MKPPIRQLRKMDIEWLAAHNCKAHGHSYLSHYNCYLREKPEDSPFHERVGFLDIEASNLSADFGYTFSYAIKEENGEVLGRVLTPKEVRSFTFDKILMQEMVNDMRKFHRVVAHYGGPGRFDLPFVRSRCLKFGIDFPLYKEIYVHDTWAMAKRILKLSRNRLENICDFFDIPSKLHKLNPTVWQKALCGDKNSLAYIWTHNVEDVVSLELVWKKLHPYVLRGKQSI